MSYYATIKILMVVGCLSTVRVCVCQQLLLGCVAIEISSSIVQNKAREFHEMREQTKQRRRQPSNLPFCFYFWFKGLQSFCFSFSVPVPLIGPQLDKSPHLYHSVGFSSFQCHFFQLLIETHPVRSP